MAFPTPKVHRPSRRKLGKGQFPIANNFTCAVTSTGTTNVTLTFNKPVLIRGNLSNTVTTRTLVSQTVVSATVVSQVWSGNVTTLAYAVPSADVNVTNYQGGQLVGTGGTFS